MLRDAGKIDAAENCFREAIAIAEELTTDVPEQNNYWLQYIDSHGRLIKLLKSTGRTEETEQLLSGMKNPRTAGAYSHRAHLFIELGEFDKALADFEAIIKLKPNDARNLINAAWALATAADNVRPKFARRAVELAQRAVELAPSKGSSWNTLGVAQYYAGDWQSAIETLNQVLELLKRDHEAFNTFFLAMAHWQLGHKDEAQTWYDRAVKWMDENDPDDEQLLRFRGEAEQLLRLDNSETQVIGGGTNGSRSNKRRLNCRSVRR